MLGWFLASTFGGMDTGSPKPVQHDRRRRCTAKMTTSLEKECAVVEVEIAGCSVESTRLSPKYRRLRGAPAPMIVEAEIIR
jgi:hypothetical protein